MLDALATHGRDTVGAYHALVAQLKQQPGLFAPASVPLPAAELAGGFDVDSQSVHVESFERFLRNCVVDGALEADSPAGPCTVDALEPHQLSPVDALHGQRDVWALLFSWLSLRQVMRCRRVSAAWRARVDDWLAGRVRGPAAALRVSDWHSVASRPLFPFWLAAAVACHVSQRVVVQSALVYARLMHLDTLREQLIAAVQRCNEAARDAHAACVGLPAAAERARRLRAELPALAAAAAAHRAATAQLRAAHAELDTLVARLPPDAVRDARPDNLLRTKLSPPLSERRIDDPVRVLRGMSDVVKAPDAADDDPATWPTCAAWLAAVRAHSRALEATLAGLCAAHDWAGAAQQRLLAAALDTAARTDALVGVKHVAAAAEAVQRALGDAVHDAAVARVAEARSARDSAAAAARVAVCAARPRLRATTVAPERWLHERFHQLARHIETLTPPPAVADAIEPAVAVVAPPDLLTLAADPAAAPPPLAALPLCPAPFVFAGPEPALSCGAVVGNEDGDVPPLRELEIVMPRPVEQRMAAAV